MNSWHFEQKVDLRRPGGQIACQDAMMINGDSDAHQWLVQVFDGSAPADLTDYNVTGYFDRADGKTVVVTGSVTGHSVCVVLPQAVYAVPGQLLGVLRASRDGQIITLAVGRWVVRKGPGDEYVDPGHVVPSLTELLDKIADMETAAQEARDAGASAINVARDAGNAAKEEAHAAAEVANAAADNAKQAANGIQGEISALKDDVDDLDREVFGYAQKIAVKYYKIAFNEVRRADYGGNLSKSAAVSEVSLLDGDGIATPILSASADSQYSNTYAAAKAIDGDLTTMWSSADAEGVVHELTLELVRPAIIERIGIVPRIKIASGVPDKMTIYASEDGETWTEAGAFVDQMDGWAEATWRFFDIDYAITKPVESIRSELTAVKYVPVLTESPDGVWEYTGLPVTDDVKTVVFAQDENSPFAGANPYIIEGENFFPETSRLNNGSSGNGITLEISGRITHISGYATASFMTYLMNGESLGFPLPDYIQPGDTIVVRTARAGSATKYMNLMIWLRSADGKYLLNKNHGAHNGSIFESEIVVPEGAVGFQLAWAVSSKTEEDVHDAYVVAAMYKKGAAVYSGNIASGSATCISSIPLPMTQLSYNANIHDYIDMKAANDGSLTYESLGYVTPEMFGAVGDKYTDDAAPMQASIDYAEEMHLPVRMYRRYATTQPIRIGSKSDVYINQIKYSGTDAAVILSGSSNFVRINRLESAGIGFACRVGTQSIINNMVELGDVICKSHGISLEGNDDSSRPVIQNRFDFRLIEAGGDGCYCIANFGDATASCITENTFFGGNCQNADWAYRGTGGNQKFYSFHVENRMKGGFCFVGKADAMIFGARHEEAARDGEYPFLKIYAPAPVNTSIAGLVSAMNYFSPAQLKVNEIDVSEVSPETINPDGHIGAHIVTAALGRINCVIVGYGVTGQNGMTIYQKFGDGCLLWANCMIFQGVPEKYYKVTQNLDLRTIGPDTPSLPTIFEIGCADCEIRLHPTYCFMGLSRFEVIQTEAYQATIYDYYAGNVVFDGSAYGAGTFEISTYASTNNPNIKGEGMAWRVRRIS